ncbi:MAG: bifunctional phosphopantothenoylcysteine decarboxylase/phosphopantothenate--cysteine ligase CoaBC [Xanthomonadales bacterium]|nr:Coenzyme A biosynthesis bifunctional protein CoaBC [Xanthomonadales bacterium]MCC6593914.1 bifunctional phosphopantothenoylcysteine decarboxylase/phosphopantothenate--cysteine ligase CoaBC [Xanthomonadales bacterium]MCE7932052.1 bifunctional phosphopantothenoylcysteine decarboxylase/phosphopantothenate--cysteine ligase CoaBC [Xanthomonadales bacterium PRO6]
MRLLLGVGGGIAAYKSAELVRRARERGAEVQVVVTAAAQEFVGSATFQALSGRSVRSSLWDAAAEAAMGHIELARWATRILIAPATADLIARLRAGIADDLLSTLCLASAAPLALAPAMNQQMWAHPAVQDNLAVLRARGVRVLGPAQGSQACGEVGAGRMWEACELLDALATPVCANLGSRRIVVSAGPTFEDLDPVRFIGNRSSGKMGFAIAAAAAAAGADVHLIAGPVHLPTPPGCRRIDVRSAQQMRTAVFAAAAGADAYIGAAAVADYRPQQPAEHKIKKGAELTTLTLVRNPDIIAELAASPLRPRLLVGFAAETREVQEYARAKLAAKGLDLIVANRVGPDAAFDRDDNALTVIAADAVQELGSGSKRELAARLVALIAERLGAA